PPLREVDLALQHHEATGDLAAAPLERRRPTDRRPARGGVRPRGRALPRRGAAGGGAAVGEPPTEGTRLSRHSIWFLRGWKSPERGSAASSRSAARRRSWSCLGARWRAFCAGPVSVTVQVGIELVEGDEVAAAERGPAAFDGADLGPCGCVDRSVAHRKVRPPCFAHELAC